MTGELSQEQMEALLRSQVTGRIGCHADGRTFVVPVTYAYGEDGYIYGSTGEGLKVALMRKNPRVCFEVDHEANLIYEDESGALNEAFADIFGELLDQDATYGDGSASPWLIAEGSSLGTIRSMSNPPAHGDPDQGTEYVCTSNDNGGVHTNSGIANKAAYLIAAGGSFNGRTVTGIGPQVSRTLLAHLVRSGAEILYHGDFDWAGLHIANALRETVPWKPWRFTAPDYGEALALETDRPGLQGRPVAALWDEDLGRAMFVHFDAGHPSYG